MPNPCPVTGETSKNTPSGMRRRKLTLFIPVLAVFPTPPAFTPSLDPDPALPGERKRLTVGSYKYCITSLMFNPTWAL